MKALQKLLKCTFWELLLTIAEQYHIFSNTTVEHLRKQEWSVVDVITLKTPSIFSSINTYMMLVQYDDPPGDRRIVIRSYKCLC